MSANTKQEQTVPPMVSVGYLATMFDVTTETVRQWNVKHGMPKVGHAKYPLKECCVWIKAFYQVQGAKQYKGGKTKHSKAEWDLRKIAAITLQEELELAVKRGEVVAISVIKGELDEILEGIRMQLKSIPGLWAGDVLGLDTKADAQEKLNDLVDDLMRNLATAPKLPDFGELEKLESEEDE